MYSSRSKILTVKLFLDGTYTYTHTQTHIEGGGKCMHDEHKNMVMSTRTEIK